MTRLIVSARHLRTRTRVVAIVHTVIKLTMIAVLVVCDIRVHIRLIMTQIHRSRPMVVVGIVVPIIRRTPGVVTRSPPMRKHRRSAHKNRTNIVVHTIDIRRADDLHVRRSITHLCGQCGHVLEDVRCQHSLNNHYVIVALDSLYNTQIINISVAVQVQRRQHICGRVEQHLKLLQRISRSKGRTYCAKVQKETDILTQRRYIDHSRGGLRRRGLDDSGGLGRLHIRAAIDHSGRGLRIHNGSTRRRSLCRGDDTGHTTAQKQCSAAQNKTNFFHI